MSSLHASPEAVKNLHDDISWCFKADGIARLEQPPSSFRFLKDFVAASRPCIIHNAILKLDGTPLQLSLDDLVDLAPHAKLTVDATPDGHGDCLRQVALDDTGHARKPVFVKPEERHMSLAAFERQLRERSSETQRQGDPPTTVFQRIVEGQTTQKGSVASGAHDVSRAVLYYSRQNDCLRSELSALWELSLFPETIPWAEEAFDTGPPDAVNLWLGDERATSSMHKDHYENLFYVLSGEKVFTLCPPADVPFLYEREIETGRFIHEGGAWKVGIDLEEDGSQSKIRWVAADVTAQSDAEYLCEYPMLEYAHPVEVRVRAGEMLFLPRLWYHRVTQTCETVGVNYWYDMKFDSPAWCYFNFMQHLTRE